MFDFRRITLFCLEKRLSKHKTTIFSKRLGRHGPFSPPWLRLCAEDLLEKRRTVPAIQLFAESSQNQLVISSSERQAPRSKKFATETTLRNTFL